MSKFYFGCLLAVFLLFGGCKKEAEPLVPIQQEKQPDIEVLEPMLLADGGVRLSVKVNSVPLEMVYGYGLLISKDSLFREVGISRSFELPMRVKTYHYDLPAGLEQGVVYYYTYQINLGLQQVSQRKSFTFGKESKVSIDSISPRSAGIGDTLKVYGKFKDYTFNKVSIGDSSMYFIRKEENVIEVPVQEKTPVGKNTISLFTAYQRVVADSLFTLLAPRILSLPQETAVGEELVIQGEYFSRYAGQNKVFINDVEVAVKSFSRSRISVIVPNSITSASLRVAVRANKQTAVSEGVVKIRAPKIVQLPAAIRINQNHTLQFEELPNVKVEIRLDDQLLSMNYRYDQGGYNYLSIIAPIVDYPNRKPKFTLKYLDQTIVLKSEIDILDRWRLIARSVPFEEVNTLGTFNINDNIFIVSTPKDYMGESIYYIWQFDSSSNTFSRIEIPYATEFPTFSAYGESIYMYSGKLTDNFYQYNTVSRSWKKLADYSAPQRHAGVMNSVKGNLYITTGQNPGDFWNPVEDPSLYRYSIQLNQWKRMEADYPTPWSTLYDNRFKGTSMVIGDEFYVIGGGRTTGNVEVYAFNTMSGHWGRKADYDAVMHASAVAKNGYGILLSNNTLKRYDPIQDSWTKLDEYLMPFVYSGHDYPVPMFSKAGSLYVVYGGLFFKMKLTDVLP
ncbi:IPT/TIG domain-containing protein [Sphingobacterium bambusae]|uniref:IPT/TIG domain-containing protein n=1 Tax=Sphingobacterium bambusae TaxID=662858 RepID=A0ABW6BBQ3_9SPHI|nr:IPT/TIG domain-containing protein [Sphingobacterium bambusae]WPL47081.1 hypothetical protein SCB77_14020 [Sphingobacterium bambusae]